MITQAQRARINLESILTPKERLLRLNVQKNFYRFLNARAYRPYDKWVRIFYGSGLDLIKSGLVERRGRNMNEFGERDDRYNSHYRYRIIDRESVEWVLEEYGRQFLV